MRIVPSFLNAALDLLLPSRCVGCGASGSYLCAECLATAEPATTLPLRPSALLAGLVVPFAYAGAPRNAVRRLKYSGLRAIAPSMAEPMAEALAAAVQSPFVLMPAPLHRKRLRQRGYNQTELLAREVSRNLGVPLRVDVLTRKRDTPPQVSTRSRAERMLNMADAFHADDPPVDEAIVIVDDVTTTGATLEAAARALRNAGASQVYGLAFCREA